MTNLLGLILLLGFSTLSWSGETFSKKTKCDYIRLTFRNPKMAGDPTSGVDLSNQKRIWDGENIVESDIFSMYEGIRYELTVDIEGKLTLDAFQTVGEYEENIYTKEANIKNLNDGFYILFAQEAGSYRMIEYITCSRQKEKSHPLPTDIKFIFNDSFLDLDEYRITKPSVE